MSTSRIKVSQALSGSSNILLVLTGQRLGHEDRFATVHSLNVPVTNTITTGQQWTNNGGQWSNDINWVNDATWNSGWTTGHSTSFAMVFDGHWLLSDELITEQRPFGTVSGLMINGVFVEGKFSIQTLNKQSGTSITILLFR